MPLVVAIDHATGINRCDCRSTPAHSDHLRSATELIDVPTRQCEIHHINQLKGCPLMMLLTVMFSVVSTQVVESMLVLSSSRSSTST